MKNEAEIYEKLISLYGAEKAANLLQEMKAENGDPPPPSEHQPLWSWDPGPEWKDAGGHFHKGGLVTDFGKAGISSSVFTAAGTKPNVLFMSPEGWEKLGEVKDMSFEVDGEDGTVQSVSMVNPPGVEVPEPTAIFLDENGAEADAFSPAEGVVPDPGEDEPKQWGDDRAAKYLWTPEQLEKADPTPPEPGLDIPDVVFDLLDEREKLAGREPLIKDGEDVEEG